MYLKKVKLSGFKSFVDPTGVHFPSALVSVVGPNGCGKSNIIDAIRWVMGESSAKQLRGDSMADVIFNGSASRSPLGQASVELFLDNSEGRLSGQYATYNEISIRRVVNREGQSQYFLNGTKCRRRDIADVFLGTGLGPRSYSIIEQGMISRIVDAKPDDLRMFFEEAAGVSKYKERRRETENRMRHTRDNLQRVADICEELDKQLERLQRQAKSAERYKVLKEEERQTKAQWIGLRWQGLSDDKAKEEQRIRDREIELQKHQTARQSCQTELEKLRSQQTDHQETYHEIQGRYYGIGADIARLEESIQNAKQQRDQMKHELDQLEQEQQAIQAQIQMDEARKESLVQEFEEMLPELSAIEDMENRASNGLQAAEEMMHDWQVRWDEFQLDSAETAQKVQVQQTRLQHFEETLHALISRSAQLQKERDGLDFAELEQNKAALVESSATLDQETRAQQDQLAQRLKDIQQQRHENQQLALKVDEAKNRLQTLRGRHASLEALQQAALGQGSEKVTAWLSQNNLAQRERLAQDLSVESGWELAVETVLGDYLEAVCVDALDQVAEVLSNLKEGQVILYEQPGSNASITVASGPTLLDKVQSQLPIANLLSHVRIASDLIEALSLRQQLAAHESVITPEGIWLARHWMRVNRNQDPHLGVLAREKELKQMNQVIAGQLSEVESSERTLQVHRDQLHRWEEERDDLQKILNQKQEEFAQVKAQITAKQGELSQARNRAAQIDSQLVESQSKVETLRQNIQEARAYLEQATSVMAQQQIERDALVVHRDEYRVVLQEAREKAKDARQKHHELRLRSQSVEMQMSAVNEGLKRLHEQQSVFVERFDQLFLISDQAKEPLLQQQKQLESLLDKRLSVEREVQDAREKIAAVDQRIRENEENVAVAENHIQQARDRLEQERIHFQELEVRSRTLKEQMTEMGYEMDSILQTIVEMDAKIEEWEERVDNLAKQIQRLGAINLAAIEEYTAEQERKTYLDRQKADLQEALATLESAIAKIDKETREKFKATFEQVNTGFQTLFPRLFGGGKAYLELTGETILDSGVGIMASPPGKKNSTIHLLSGGEKALTAVALVFAIFQLNPAPFCMLDEVDAPLDDANVGRFCQLVKEMSENVQFIFITHNKITMEMASHLMGVTMQEPGVSRLVAVDIDEAIAMAEA